MLLLTLRGTPTVYYGEEIGMKDIPISSEQVQDPAEKNEPGLGLGRDPERAPMPWDKSVLAGFTSGKPWLPLGPDHAICNVQSLRENPRSILNLYRRLVELRRHNSALTRGAINAIRIQGNVLLYERSHGDDRTVIILNLGHEPACVSHTPGRLLLSTYLDRDGNDVVGDASLRADEGIIVEVTSTCTHPQNRQWNLSAP